MQQLIWEGGLRENRGSVPAKFHNFFKLFRKLTEKPKLQYWASVLSCFSNLRRARFCYSWKVQQLVHSETEYHETKVVLSAEGENLSNKLGSMKEYEVQRAELMAKFDKIEAELNRQLQEQQKVYIKYIGPIKGSLKEWVEILSTPIFSKANNLKFKAATVDLTIS